MQLVWAACASFDASVMQSMSASVFFTSDRRSSMHTLRIARTAASSFGSSAVSTEHGARGPAGIRSVQCYSERKQTESVESSWRRSRSSLLQQAHDVMQQTLRATAVLDVHQLREVRLNRSHGPDMTLVMLQHGCSPACRAKAAKAKQPFAPAANALFLTAALRTCVRKS